MEDKGQNVVLQALIADIDKGHEILMHDLVSSIGHGIVMKALIANCKYRT